jgi:hypothetical protein
LFSEVCIYELLKITDMATFVYTHKGEMARFIDPSKALDKWHSISDDPDETLVRMKSGWFIIRHTPYPYHEPAFEIKLEEAAKWLHDNGWRYTMPKETEDFPTELE